MVRSPQRISTRERTHSMKRVALIEATLPRPPLSNKERIAAHRNRDTVGRTRPPASHAEAQRVYRERCRAQPPPPPPPPPVCAYRGKTCLEIAKELRRGHLPLPLDLLGPPGRLCDVCRKKKDALVCRRRCRVCTLADDIDGLPSSTNRCHCHSSVDYTTSCVETLLSSKPRVNRLCPVCRQRLEAATSFPNPPLSIEAELAMASQMGPCRCGKFQPHPNYPDVCFSGQSFTGRCGERRTDFSKRAQNALQRLTAAKAQMPSDHVGAESRPPEPPSSSFEAPIAEAPAASDVPRVFADSACQGGAASGETINNMSAPASSTHAALQQSSSSSSHFGKSSTAVAANDNSAAGAGAAVSGCHELPVVPWWFEPCFNFEHETSDADPTKCKCGRDLTVEGIRVRNAMRAPKECANPECKISAEEAAARPQSALEPCPNCSKVYYCAPYGQRGNYLSSCMSNHRAAHAPICFVAKCTADLNDLS